MHQSENSLTFRPIAHTRVGYNADYDAKKYRWRDGKLVRRSKVTTLRAHREGR